MNLLIRTGRNQRQVPTKKAPLSNRNPSLEMAPHQTPHRRPLTLKVYLIRYHFHKTRTITVNIQCLPVTHTIEIFSVHSSTHNLAARISPTWCHDRPSLSANWLAHVCYERELASCCSPAMDRNPGLRARLLSLCSILSSANRLAPTPGV